MLLFLKKYFDGFLHLIFPKICLHCGSEELPNENVICSTCYSKLPFTDFLQIENNVVEKIFWGRVSLGASGAALFFTKNSIVQLLIFELKYKKNKRAGWMLGHIIAETMKLSNRFNHIDYLIPVPLRRKKERNRGYNQTYIICEGIAHVLAIPIEKRVLYKKKPSLSQTQKGRIERGQTSNRLFSLKNSTALFNKRLLLVDDVITTGATAESACLCLQQAKPADIQFVAAAYTLT